MNFSSAEKSAAQLFFSGFTAVGVSKFDENFDNGFSVRRIALNLFIKMNSQSVLVHKNTRLLNIFTFKYVVKNVGNERPRT